ncbi:methyl-accepting chemotaxis protein [Halorhodospira halochloris]|uniref:Methyl-accepting chemotaxis protein n=1 Tax=Halorhodospira halochloris TaxID=1052 RepID=A0A0X8X795_HALHR|nr:methyl-accepting chemotaxis protein [Halorhodospira halochloris]MBK1652448.1 hypothetical protein [Halorhodospira halochloris]BAU56342.1 methyl-accepting chemotaxis protein [Halorhodospira halochloris]
MNSMSIASQLRSLVALALAGVVLVIGIGWVSVTSTLSNQQQLREETRPLDEAGRVIAESLDGYSQLRGQMANADSVDQLQSVPSADEYSQAFVQQLEVFESSTRFMDNYGSDVTELRDRFEGFSESYQQLRPELERLLSLRADLVSQVDGIVEFFDSVEGDIEGLFGEALADYEQRAGVADIGQVDHAARALARAIEVSRALRDVVEASSLDELEQIHDEDLVPSFEAMVANLESFERIAAADMASVAQDLLAAVGAFNAWMFADQGSVLVAKEQEVEALESVNEAVAANEDHHQQLRDAALELANSVDQAVVERTAESEAQVQSSLVYFVLAGILVALTMTVPLYIVSRRLHERIKQLRDEVNAMQPDASTIDISRELTVIGNNELSNLAASFNEVLRTVRSAVGEVLEASQEVEKQAKQTSESTQRSREMAQTQSSQTDEIATAMNEMASTVQEVSSNTQVAHQHTTQAAEKGLEIKDLAEAGVNEMGRLSSTMDNSRSVVDRLAERSEEVGKITASIQEIADQTNLLSLNAAIEAARAGSEGRGFAVVAEEVRNLATNTQDLTKQIHAVIEGLREDAKESAQTIHNGREQAARSAEEVERIKAAVENVHNSLSGLEEQVALIASAAEEQSNTAEEVNRNVQGLNDLASENAHVIERLNEGGAKLSEVAARLRSHSQRFRI